ncbi:hypothetical protein B0G73_13339 [Paraburkholderia sp. BL25I1N1]|nr:hypothetical protein B0G73_13339 [Paraburkholderia sp. BL25I1N1]
MKGRTLDASAEGLERPKAHRVAAWRERKQRIGVGYSGVYFRGMVSGLALAEALYATVPFGVASSITDEHGCKVEAPHSGQAR